MCLRRTGGPHNAVNMQLHWQSESMDRTVAATRRWSRSLRHTGLRNIFYASLFPFFFCAGVTHRCVRYAVVRYVIAPIDTERGDEGRVDTDTCTVDRVYACILRLRML